MVKDCSKKLKSTYIVFFTFLAFILMAELFDFSLEFIIAVMLFFFIAMIVSIEPYFTCLDKNDKSGSPFGKLSLDFFDYWFD